MKKNIKKTAKKIWTIPTIEDLDSKNNATSKGTAMTESTTAGISTGPVS